MSDNFTPLHSAADDNNKQIQPVSHGPESEPIPSLKPSEAAQIHEVVEHDIQDEEVKAHVEVHKDIPEIPEEVKKAGVTATPTTNFPAYQQIQLPESDEKVMEGLKKPINTSDRWLAVLCLYLLNQVHLTLKMIHGKATRVTKK